MQNFKSSLFFSYENFKHKSLLDKEFVWDALKDIERYFEEFENYLIQSPIPSSCIIENEKKVFIGKNVLIEPFTYIKGPCIIGDNSEIRQGAYIRENVITGKRCILGHCSEIKNSILLNDVKVAHFNYVGDSILGNRVNLGAGVKCANFKLNGSKVKLLHGKEIIKTNLNKLGAIIGDDVQIGCNSVCNPGTIIGKNTFCYALCSLSGVIESNSIKKGNFK